MEHSAGNAQRVVDDFTAVVNAMKALWKKEAGPTPRSEDITRLLVKAESALRESAGTPVLEVLCFSEATSDFFPLIGAISTNPETGVEAQVAALNVLKLFLATASNTSATGAALLARLFGSLRLLDGLCLSISANFEQSRPTIVLSLAETIFVAVATNASVCQLVLSSANLPDIISFMRSSWESYQTSYFFVAFFRILALTPSRDHSNLLLAAANLHQELLFRVKRYTGEGDEAGATVMGLALQVLAIMTENSPQTFSTLFDDPSIGLLAVKLLSSKWSEVICGVNLWLKAMAKVAPRGSPVLTGLISSGIPELLLDLVGAITVPVAVHSAATLRELTIAVKPALMGKVVFGSPRLYHSLLAVLLDDTLSAAVEDRLLRAEVATLIGTLLAAVPAHRRIFAARLEKALISTGNPIHKLRQVALDSLSEFHPTVFACIDVEAILGESGCQLVKDSGMVNLQMIVEVLDKQEDANNRGRKQLPNADTTSVLTFSTFVERGIFIKELFKQSFELTFAHLHIDPNPSLNPVPSHEAHASHAAETCDKAVKLILQLSRSYGPSSGPGPKEHSQPPTSSLGKGTQKERNVWAPKQPLLQVQPVRQWRIEHLEKSYLFSFSLARGKWREGLRVAIQQCKGHLLFIHRELKLCPTKDIFRRALLTDLHTVIIPKILICLKLVSSILQKDGGEEMLQSVLKERGEDTIDAGNLHDLYVALVS
jgi:hypothetical protein